MAREAGAEQFSRRSVTLMSGICIRTRVPGRGHSDTYFGKLHAMSPVARMYIMGAIIGVVGSTALISSVFAAEDLRGATTAQSTMYAGPGDAYPQVMRLTAGLQIGIHGCTHTAAWCDVTWRGKRGWVPAAALELRENGDRMPVSALTVPETTFELASYWAANYKTRLWYRDRAKWKNLGGRAVQSAQAGAQ